jgi:glycosyltransferase involved in cell wall biosynthesis
VVPNGVDTKYFDYRERVGSCPNILFVGNFAYPPNEDGFWYFYKEIFPLLRKRIPAAIFWAAGRDPTPQMCALYKQDFQVRITGFVPDMRTYYEKAAVCVVPIRIGGGTRLKILEAFSAGVPVVSTSVGVEGIMANPDEHLLVKDTARQFADGIEELLQQPQSANRLASKARQLVEDKYDWSAIGNQLEQTLSAIQR